LKPVSAFALLLILFLAACGSPGASGPSQAAATASPAVLQASAVAPRRLMVFAASSLTDAFGEIGNAFEAEHPGVQVALNFAGSQALRTQIEQGAPADVFVSASPAEMNALVAERMVDQAAQHILLTNQLVVILPPGNPAGLSKLEDLAAPGLKLVLAAQDVPVGGYARQALDKMNAEFGNDFKQRVLSNVVSNEDNVKQVVAKVELGEADAGIVYASDAAAAPDLRKLEIPASLNIVASYPIARVANSANSALASEFVQFALAARSQATLAKWGFGPLP
jgi:molybdate transport system substrate-binding protein